MSYIGTPHEALYRKLVGINCEQYMDTFVSNDISLDLLPSLSDAEWDQLHIKIG
jgi:hypothetical protein